MIYEYCILLKGSCELFQLGNGSSICSGCLTFFACYRQPLSCCLLAVQQHTHITSLGWSKPPRSVCHSTVCHFATDIIFSYYIFFAGVGHRAVDQPLPGISEIWGCIIPHPNCTISTRALLNGTWNRIPVRWAGVRQQPDCASFLILSSFVGLVFPEVKEPPLPIQLKHVLLFFSCSCSEGLESSYVGKGEAFTSQSLSGFTSLSTQGLKAHLQPQWK